MALILALAAIHRCQTRRFPCSRTARYAQRGVGDGTPAATAGHLHGWDPQVRQFGIQYSTAVMPGFGL